MPSNPITVLTNLARELSPNLIFTMLEVGAVPLGGQSEPFHGLLDAFPGSRIYAFEVDELLCKDLNKNAKNGLIYYPVALGRSSGVHNFYETNHPMCSSLYKPNEALIDLYNSLEVAKLKSTTTVNTITIDQFIETHDVTAVDFIKIDVQGAELDIFSSGISALSSAVAIVSEVEFIRLYEEQPLFGDISNFLENHGFIFHKFLGLSGRSLRPVVVNNNINYPTQHMWSDAVFIKNVQSISQLNEEQLFKLAIIALIYDSPDVAVFCLSEYDRRNATHVAKELLEWSKE